MVPDRGILVLDGADASGKTTLAKHFIENHGARYLRDNGKHGKKVWRWHLATIQCAAHWAREGLVVVDRHWQSELAYGSVYRGGPAYNLGARSIDRMWRRFGALHVLAAPADSQRQIRRHAQRHKAGGEMYANVERVTRLYADLRDGNPQHWGTTYLDQLVRLGDYQRRGDTIVYDLDHDGKNLKGFADRALRQLRHVRYGQLQVALDPTNGANFAGSLADAKVFFVTEGRPGEDTWPGVSGDHVVNGTTLINRALQDMAFDERHGVWAAAGTAGDAHWIETLCEFHRKYRHIKVVAIGKIAAHELRANGFVAVRQAPHPVTYWKGGGRDYTKVLADALA